MPKNNDNASEIVHYAQFRRHIFYYQQAEFLKNSVAKLGNNGIINYVN